MSTKSARMLAHVLAENYDVRLLFSLDLKPGTAGGAIASKATILLNPEIKDLDLYSALFHEIAHCVAYRNGKFVKYHTGKCSKKYLRMIALRAEIYVDDLAFDIAKKHKFKYKRIYKYNQEMKDFLKNYYGY